MGRRFTWVIVAGVGALLLFAGLDGLRSLGGSETAVPTTNFPSTATSTPTVPLPRDIRSCARLTPLSPGSTSSIPMATPPRPCE